MQDYLTELATTAPRDFFRPHFFVNTPDINPIFLQTSGRAGFLIRAALAATLSGLWGVYSGFELCEATAAAGEARNISNSEKYQLRAWDWDRPGNIVAEITRLNRIRRAQSGAADASRRHASTTPSTMPSCYYAKATPDRSNVLLVAVSLDPHQRAGGRFEAPLWEWGLRDNGALEVEDLLSGGTRDLARQMQHVGLIPRHPYAIWRVAPGRVTDTTDARMNKPTTATADRDPLWYKDAVIYQLHVKSFFDGNNDGVGDFTGLLAEARLHRRTGRDRDLAAAVLSLAAARRRLRHRRLSRRASRLRHARATSRGSSTRRMSAGCASSPSW